MFKKNKKWTFYWDTVYTRSSFAAQSAGAASSWRRLPIVCPLTLPASRSQRLAVVFMSPISIFKPHKWFLGYKLETSPQSRPSNRENRVDYHIMIIVVLVCSKRSLIHSALRLCGRQLSFPTFPFSLGPMGQRAGCPIRFRAIWRCHQV